MLSVRQLGKGTPHTIKQAVIAFGGLSKTWEVVEHFTWNAAKPIPPHAKLVPAGEASAFPTTAVMSDKKRQRTADAQAPSAIPEWGEHENEGGG